MAAPEQDLTTKLAMSLEEIINLNQNVGGEVGSSSPSGGEGEREGGRPFRRGKRFPRGGGDKPYPRPTGSAAVTNRVYVGNLPWQTSWQDLKDHMRSTGGNVVYADVFLDEYGRSKGCGIVEYATREEALNAIKALNDTKIGDSERLIFVREDRETVYIPQRERVPRGGGGGGGRGRGGSSGPSGENAAGRQVFVRNLAYATSWQDLKDYFKGYGRVVRAEALTSADGTPKGQGTVLFETREDAQNAIARANNTELQGRVIVVQEDKYVQ
jgi:RNA recognition motif-containing protein